MFLFYAGFDSDVRCGARNLAQCRTAGRDVVLQTPAVVTGWPGSVSPMPGAEPRVGAVVLAGGRSRRFGTDKLAAQVAGRPLLDSAVSAARAAADAQVVVVGPVERPLPEGVLVTREEPAYAGPFAAVAAGLALVDADVVLVLAGDLIDPAPALPALLGALAGDPHADAAVLLDATGRRQPLLAAFRVTPLRGCVVGVDTVGRAAGELLDGLHVVEVHDDGDWSRDVDAPGDLPH
jgi:molybdopterin-guanine dinucleotide biosynthesis protein A